MKPVLCYESSRDMSNLDVSTVSSYDLETLDPRTSAGIMVIKSLFCIYMELE